MTQDSLANGAINDGVLAFLKKGFNPLFRGKNWEAVLESIASAEEFNWENAQRMIWQLFISSAEEDYLDRRAFDEGYERPKNTNLPDELFRKLVIALRTNKITHQAFLNIIQIFYGPEYTQASIACTALSSYQLDDLDDLDIVLDNTETVKVIFEEHDFSSIGTATAVEVAAAITRRFQAVGSKAFAIARTVWISNLPQQIVVIFSGRIGLRSSVQIIGGKANIALQFPTCLYPVSIATEWTITLGSTPGRLKIAPTAGGLTDIAFLEEGDLVYIYGAGFSEVNRGAFAIKRVNRGTSIWIEIDNPLGISEVVPVTTINDLTFFRPTLRTLYSNPQYAIIAEVDGKTKAVLPSTTGGVARDTSNAGYLNGQVFQIDMGQRVGNVVSVNSVAPVNPDDWVMIDGVRSSRNSPTAIPGTPSTDVIMAGETDKSLGFTVSETNTVRGLERRAVNLKDGVTLFLPGQFNGIVDQLAPWVIYETAEEDDATGRKISYTWVAIPTNLTTGTVGYAYTKLDDNRVVVLGGQLADGTLIDRVNVLGFTYPSTMTLYDAGAGLNTTSYGYAISGVGSEAILFGGIALGVPVTSITSINPDEGTSLLIDNLQIARSKLAVTRCSGGILVIGGMGVLGNALAQCERCTSIGAAPYLVCPMSYARYDFGMVHLPDDRVMVFGGIGKKATAAGVDAPLSSCEMYKDGVWSRLPDMPFACSNPTVEYIAQTNEIIALISEHGVYSLNLDTYKWTSRGGVKLDASYGAKLKSDVVVWAGGSQVGGFQPYTGGIYINGESTYDGGTLNVIAKVENAGGGMFSYKTPDSSYVDVLRGGSVTLFKAAPSTIGSYIFDKAEEGLGVPKSFWLTDSVAGRVAVEKLLKDYKESETQLDIDVVYPSDRGLGNQGFPAEDSHKLSDKVRVWGGDNLDGEAP